MLPGVVWYDGNKAANIDPEMIWIDVDAMKKSAASMVGKPIYVFHQKVNLETIEDDIDGWITECFYNELDGWLWAKMLVISDEGQKAIAQKWNVSNAYTPNEWDGAGQHLNVDYNRKIRDYSFTHLAIVPNPRYEEAKIYTPEEFKAYQATKKTELAELQNSKPNEQESALMFFRQNKQEIKAGDTILDTDFTEIKNDDGTTSIVTVGELKEAKRIENAKKNEKMVDDDEEIEIDGEKVNMGALKECYKNMKSVKKNETEAEDKERAKKEEEKKNAEEAEKKKAEDEEKKKTEDKENDKRFKEFQNAHNKNMPAKVDTIMDKKARGTARYGSAKK